MELIFFECMNFSSFVLKIIVAYLIYYGINILYDVFIKKDKSSRDNDSERVVDFGDVIQEETIDVTDHIEPISIEEKYNHTITSNIKNSVFSESTENEKNTDNIIPDTMILVDEEDDSDEIDLPIEGQAIPFEALLKEGKELFSNVNF
ncbi:MULTISPECIES: hypothetical protein [Capnocytophaga]|uniref:Uncharacterized protein n=1 Tax=Capnocytophaga canis TaxID=1848903 RepID=A0A0B7IME6_9FLAO|nr:MULTISPECIES: hypothetical protein [Capnocytophaga]CEN53045.1 conserved hypothetical protein [Capnocytophaga canis]